MEKRRRQIVAVLFIFLLMIATVPIIGTESDLSLAGSGAELTGIIYDDDGVDEDGDGFFDYLRVDVQVNVTEAGIYRVNVHELVSSNGIYINVSRIKSMYLDVGLQAVNVSLHGPTIYLSGLNPVNVSGIDLHDVNWDWLSNADNIPLSREYSYTDFDAPGASLTGVIFDNGTDTDGNSLFDFLDVGVQVNVTEPRIYQVDLSWLRDANFSYIYVYGYISEYLDVGLQVLNLSLDGPTIYASGVNPSFVNSIWLRDDSFNIGSLSDIPLFHEYLYTQFDAPPPSPPPGASLTGEIIDQGVDSDGDGKFDYLEVGVPINVTTADTYQVDVSRLRDAYWNYTYVWDYDSSYFDVGVHLLNVTLFGPTIHAYGFNPKYVSYIYLYDENGTYLDDLYDVSLSKEYSYTNFDVPGAILTGAVYDRGVDTDSDGAFNYLEVSVEINVTESGLYQLYVSELKDVEMNYIPVWDSVSTYFGEGTQLVNMSLDGSAIYNSGRNPKFISDISLRDENYNYLGEFKNVPLSHEYMYNEFESPTATLTYKIVDEGVDSDGDGSFDYLKVGVEINVTEAGEYRLHVNGLRDDELDYINVYDSRFTYLDAGLQLVNVSLWGPAIYISGLDPRLVSWIDLYDANWNYFGGISNKPLSREYQHTEFDAPGARLTGVISDSGTDSDGDGLFNYLEVGVEVNVTEAGFYQVQVSGLEDAHFSYISVYDSEYLYLVEGLHTVNLTLYGLRIYTSGLNPAFVSYIYLQDENYRDIGSLSRVALSHEYSYNDFDPPRAVLTGKIHDQGLDLDGDGTFDYLQIGVEINVTDSGYYRVEVSGLQDSSFNHIDMWDYVEGYFDPGVHVLNVSLHGPAIYGSGLNPMYVSSIYLYDDYYSYLYSVPLSREYSYTEFDLPGAMLTTVVYDYGVDTDGDGEFNYLQVGVEINVTEAGYYEVGVSGLLDADHNYIGVYGSQYLYLYNGTQVVYLSLDGWQIHRSGINPRYVNHIWLVDENYRHIGSLDDVPLSREYSYTEFESPGAVFTGTIYDRGVDTDIDGAFNYLEVGLEVNITEAGNYEVSLDGLRDTEGRWVDVYGYAKEYLDIGIQVLNFSLNGLTIYLSELNPKYIGYASLWDQNYNQLDELGDVSLSKEYSYTDFDPPGAVLTGVIFDQGVDTDADGTYDYLKIGVQVSVTDPGYYYVDISELLDSNFENIDVYNTNFTFLDAGLQIVYLYLEGPRIYLSHRNPSYVNHIGLRDEYYTYFDSLSHIPLSREYSYTDFDPPAAMLTGQIYDQGVDTDGDGAFNYLEIGVEINVTKAGTYRASVDGLRDIYGNWISVWGSESGYFDVGLGVFNVSLDGPPIYASRNNPRYVNYISLYADYYDSLHDILLSREYLYTEFDFPAVLTGVISDRGVDTDADGTYDYLEVGVQVNVSDSGTYVLSVSGLRDAYYNYIGVRDSKTIYLDAGVQNITLYLYGPQIYITRRNPTTVSDISLRVHMVSYVYYYWYYDSISDVPLSREYSYTEFDAPFLDVETKFVVYPDGRVAVEGALNYTNMLPENTPRYTTAQGFFNITGDELSSQASAGLTLNLPTEIASEFPYNSTTAQMLAQYSNGLLNSGINSTMFLSPDLASQYPFNTTDGTLNATYSEGIFNIDVEGNTTLPSSATSQFPFNATDITVVGTYSPNTLDGTITFSVIDEFTFDDVDVDFTGNDTDLTLNGTVHVVFNVPFNGLIIRNETELNQMIDQLKSELPEIVWNMTGGLLNVTNLDIDYELNGIGASVTFKIDVHGDFVRALAYVLSGGRNELLLSPVLNEAYQSVQSGSFDIRYNHTTLEASMKLTFSYDLKRLIDYVLTPPTETTPYIMCGPFMSPTLWMGDLVMVEEVPNAGDIVADPENGDIIAYYYPSDQRYVVIRRAINVTDMNGTLYFTTKGDANWSPDPWSVPENLVIGRAVRRVPLLGYLVSFPYLFYPYYYSPYPQNTTEARLSLLNATFNCVENMSVQLSYSSVDKRFDFRQTQVDKLKALADEITLLLPEILPPETPPEIRSFVESLLNTTYASVDSANVSFMYENGKADFEATVAIEGDINAEVNYVKDLFFQLLGAQLRYDNVTAPWPWQLDFINQTKVDISNFEISAELGETSIEGKIKGLTFTPPTDALNTTHFKLERLFNLTAPQYPWQQEFPGQYQGLKITIEGGSNATHGVTIFRDPQTVPEPDATTPHTMIWHNQTLSSLKDLVFNIRELSQYDLGWIVGKVVDADFLSPIIGASITTDGLTATTDANGYYIITDVPPDDYTVNASAVDYTNGSKTVHIDSGVTASVNFALASTVPRGTLTVITTPVAGEVFVNGTYWGIAPQSRVILVGTYNVSFGDFAGYYTPAWQLVTVSENVTYTVTGVYEPILGAIDGTVTDSSNGDPIEGATVTANGYFTFTNDSGYYELEVEPGTYTVTAEADGYQSESVFNVTVAAEVTTTVDFQLTPGVPPVASFTYTPIDPLVNETVTFDASGSYDPNGTIVNYEWDFGDGISDTGLVVTHAYSTEGTFTVTLTVTDNDGLTDTTAATVTISLPTTLYVYPPVSSAMPGETFTIDIRIADVAYLYAWQVNMSFDPTVLEFVNVTEGDFLKSQPEGTVGFSRLDNVTDGWALFAWTTIGPYQGVNGSGTLATVEFRVLTEGESEIKFETDPIWIDKDGDGEVDEDEWVYMTYLVLQLSRVPPPQFVYIYDFRAVDGYFSNVAIGEPPVAAFSYSPSEPSVDETVTFNASASYDPDGIIAIYFWEFGDGTNVTTTSFVLVNHVYVDVGTYIVTLTVTDNDNLTDTIASAVTVSSPELQPPVADFTYSPESPVVDEMVTFDPSASYDPDGVLVTFFWQLGDGAIKYTLTSVPVDHAYADTGTYTVRLTVTDDHGLTDTYEETVTVTLPLIHDIAVQSVTASPSEVTAGELITIEVAVLNEGNAEETFDVEVSYDATLIGTQSVTLATGASETLSFTWDTSGVSPGVHTIKAEAIVTEDQDPADNILTTSVTIKPALQPPIASFTYSPSEPVVGETVTFDASESYDPDGTIASYSWDFRDGNSASGELTNHAYSVAGDYNVTLTVVDDDDLTDTTWQIITVLLAPKQWTLTVNSYPIDGVDFTIDGVTDATPWSNILDEGSYTVAMPSTWIVDTNEYVFDHWEDASTDPTRTVSLTSDLSITAYYVLAPRHWTLTVNSDPITGVEFTLDGVPQITPYSASLIEGSHTITMPSSWIIDEDVYNFDHWEDGSTNPTRTISLTEDTTITATYELYVPPTGWIDGYVTDDTTEVALVGATVTADGVSATTDAAGYYTIETVPGTYTVTASMAGYVDDAATGVVIAAGETTIANFALASIPPIGTLSVNTTPVSGEVFVNGMSWGTASQSRVVQVGTYNVSFGDVAGYSTPTWQLVTVSENVETPVTGVYTLITGTLRIRTSPVAGEVFVNGTSWGTAPLSRVVPVGIYIVSFGHVDGFYTPANQVATISENLETTIRGVYEPEPEVVVEEITEPELVNATNPFIVDATEHAATSLVISEISDPVTVVAQNVTRERAETEGVDPPPGTWEALGNYVQITVNNTDITVNATIRIYYTLEQLEDSGLDESTLEIRFWNATSGEWEPVESHVNTEEHYVWAITDHFSLFAILGQPGAAPLPTQLWLAIAIIMIIAVTLVSAIYIRRRKTAITHNDQRP